MLSADYRGKILVLKLSGELKKEHLAEADELIDDKLDERESPPILLDLRRYEGAEDLSTAWQELKLLTTHGDRVEKIAVVGSLDWQKL
ncbi:MAG: STAS/SEC14 domain-containing protein, partial [Thermoanaerobaculia bacterium]